MIAGIEHIAVCSKDTAALKDWYIKVFGMKQVYDNGKGTYFVAAADGSMIEIIKETSSFEKTEIFAGGIRHFALSVTADEFDPMVEKIKAAGAETLTEPTEKNGIRTYFFRDPDGNIFHLIYRPNPLV